MWPTESRIDKVVDGKIVGVKRIINIFAHELKDNKTLIRWDGSDSTEHLRAYDGENVYFYVGAATLPQNCGVLFLHEWWMFNCALLNKHWDEVWKPIEAIATKHLYGRIQTGTTDGQDIVPFLKRAGFIETDRFVSPRTNRTCIMWTKKLGETPVEKPTE